MWQHGAPQACLRTSPDPTCQRLAARLQGGLLAAPLRPLHHWEWLRQLPLLALVSAGGGLLGAAFNRLRLAARPLRARAKDHAARLREVALVAAATTTAIAALAAAVGRCAGEGA